MLPSLVRWALAVRSVSRQLADQFRLVEMHLIGRVLRGSCHNHKLKTCVSRRGRGGSDREGSHRVETQTASRGITGVGIVTRYHRKYGYGVGMFTW